MKRFYKTMALVSLLGISNLSCGELGDARADAKAIDIQLWEAVYQNKPKEVKGLLAVGANKEAQNKGGKIPLHLAADDGYTEVVKILLAAGANKEAKDNMGETPLHKAASFWHTEEVAKVLLAFGASREATDSYGRTPRDYASYFASVKRLLA
jgi:ankyrin repeat protein